MGLKDLLLPKWRKSNPAVRAKAVSDMDSTDSLLIEKIILKEPDTSVRIIAIRKTENRSLLHELLTKETDISVIEGIKNRLDTLYKIQIMSCDNTKQRIDLVPLISDETVLTELAVAIDEPLFRTVVVEHINTPELLCTIAESNCGVKAGGAVVDKLNDPELLKKLVSSASSKKIRKQAAEKARKFTPDIAKKKRSDKTDPPPEAAPIEEKLNQIITYLKTLDFSEGVSAVKKHLDDATNQWVALDPDFSTDLFSVFFRLKESLTQEMPEAEKREKIHNKLETIIVKMEKLSRSDLLSDREDIDSIESEFQIVLSERATIDKHDFVEKFNKARQRVESHFSDLRKKEETAKALEDSVHELIKTITDLKNKNNLNDRTTCLNERISRWKQIIADQVISDHLIKSFEEAVQNEKEDFKSVQKIREEQLKAKKDELNKAFACVKKASDAKENDLFSFTSEVKEAKDLWRKSEPQLSEHKEGLNDSFYENCRLYYEKLDDHRTNKDWEKWANLNRKKELCRIAENVGAAVAESRELRKEVQAIRELQSEWKETGPVAKEHSEAIWNKFNDACDMVYHTCLEKKKSIYKALKEITANENPGFKDAAKKITEIQEAWNLIGSLPLNLEKEIREGFQSECDDFFNKRRAYYQQKDEERLENLKIKSSLCEEAEHYANTTQWKETAGIFKNLQKRWKEAGPVPREESDAIWERFSSSCNHFFDAYDTYRKENLSLKAELCDQADKLLETVLDHVSAEEACRQAITLQKKWKNTGPAPRDVSDEIWKRFRAACDAIFDRRSELTSEALEDQSDVIAAKEKLIDRAEALAHSTEWSKTAAELKEIQKEWKTLGQVIRQKENELWARLRSACDTFFNQQKVVFNEKDQQRSDNKVLKEEACINLELLAKIVLDDSIEVGGALTPAELLLKARDLRDHVEVPGDKKATLRNLMKLVKEIQAQWKCLGPAPAPDDNFLWKRYKAVTDKIYASV